MPVWTSLKGKASESLSSLLFRSLPHQLPAPWGEGSLPGSCSAELGRDRSGLTDRLRGAIQPQLGVQQSSGSLQCSTVSATWGKSLLGALSANWITQKFSQTQRETMKSRCRDISKYLQKQIFHLSRLQIVAGHLVDDWCVLSRVLPSCVDCIYTQSLSARLGNVCLPAGGLRAWIQWKIMTVLKRISDIRPLLCLET